MASDAKWYDTVWQGMLDKEIHTLLHSYVPYVARMYGTKFTICMTHDSLISLVAV